MDQRMDWLHEPGEWRVEGDNLAVATDAKTDFWHTTHYGFVRDNGHFYGMEVTGDFVATVTVRGQYRDQYDQAGLMVRLDETTWLKTGVEFVEGVPLASVVVTRGFSDWSVAPLPPEMRELHLRVIRQGGAIEVRVAADDGEEMMLRLAYLTDEPAIRVGPMCAAPDGEGFEVTFQDFAVDAQ
jgi:regulation of enolase protein 1 (concanavalin A-like superfamily)